MKRATGSMFGVFTAALLACATPARPATAQAVRQQSGGYELEVLVDGVPTPRFMHAGESFVMGALGARYTLRVWNRTGRRIEAVVSVDGRDVVDGRPADVRKRGYLVPAYGSVDVDGWRLSDRRAAAFRFSTVSGSYVAQTGSARNVGVIGVAVFPERVAVSRPIEIPRRWHYEPEAPYYDGASDDVGAAAESQAPAAGAPAKSAPSRGAMADADGAGRARESSVQRRPGLGTGFGEQVQSEVREVSFVRAHASRPQTTLGARYNDRDGLMALGIDVDGRFGEDDLALRQSAQPFPVSQRFAAPPPGWRRY